MISASFNSSMISPACHSFIRFSNGFKWSFDFHFRNSFCKRRLDINLIALNAISFNGDSYIHSPSVEILSIKFFPACLDGNKNRFFFPYTIFFCKREIDFSQTNNLSNWLIYIAEMELKYEGSQYLNHQMFDRFYHLHFFHVVIEHKWFSSSDNMI